MSHTPEQVREYISDGGNHCPFCGAVFITTTSQIDAESCSQPILCERCGETWKDIYKLIGINHEGEDITGDPLHDAAPELLSALELLTQAIDLGKLNIRKDFSLINAHANATKTISKARGEGG